MTARFFRPLAVGGTILSLTACASIVSDSQEMVTISSNPTAAQIAIADQSGVEDLSRRPPPPPSRSMPVPVTSMGRNIPSPSLRRALTRRQSRSIAGSTAGTSCTILLGVFIDIVILSSSRFPRRSTAPWPPMRRCYHWSSRRRAPRPARSERAVGLASQQAALDHSVDDRGLDGPRGRSAVDDFDRPPAVSTLDQATTVAHLREHSRSRPAARLASQRERV